MSGTSGKAISQLNTAQSISGSDIIPITQNVAGNQITNGASAQQLITFTSNPVIPVSVNTAGVPASTVYHETAASMTFADNLQSVSVNPSGSELFQTTAVAGYIRNQNPTVDGLRNGVALFGLGICEVDDAFTWGINTVAGDSATAGSGSGTGRLIQNEFDFNVSYASTTVNGLVLGGDWYAQPANSNGFIVLKPATHNGNWCWGAAFLSGDGAAKYALAGGLYESASGDSIPSQLIRLSNTDSSGTYHQTFLQVQPGNILTITADTTPTLSVVGNFEVSGTATGTTPAQTDNSTNFATTAWTSEAGICLGGQFVVSGSVTLTNAVIGQLVPITTAGITVTMPASATMPRGRGFWLLNESSGEISVACQGSDSIGITALARGASVWISGSGGTAFWTTAATIGTPKTSITGSRGSALETVVENLLQALQAMGLVTDNTTT